jgi:hypothetical protein
MPPSRFLLVAAALLAAGGVRAQLATMSPFMPAPGSPGAAVPTADAPLEFRGVAELPDGPAFRVVDPARKLGSWVRLNQRDADLGVTVKQHDAAHDTVTVEQQGRTFTLALRQSKVASAGPVMAPAARNAVPAIAGMAPRPPAAPLQQAQIDAVAAAVAQRRALRDQAAQQISQGVPLAPQVIQQQQNRAQNAAAPGPRGQNFNTNAAGQNPSRKRNRQP